MISLVWKEPGLGSQQKLAQVKRLFSNERGRKGIGHCGTLDPFAEGILCVGMGEGTKILSALVGLTKTYVAEMVLGATTETLDSESELVFADGVDLASLSDDKLLSFLAAKVGKSEQIPPQHSAVRVDGKRAYDLARRGETVELKARPIEIFATRHLELANLAREGRSLKKWKFEVTVSSGTYIRAFARDWARELTGHAGFLQTLVRTQLGPWRLPEAQDRALEVGDFSELIPTVAVKDETVVGLKHGRWNPSLVSPVGDGDLRGYLVVAEEKPGIPLALLNPDRSLQRVFVANPFD
ncbi:MAG TPA: tRNA pseudouridine(55) synthase TruB [Bdellovibrionota bacterium]|jgi:tRNA pseudouridine55 synthase|nr:tRNA pseudouridine(55) synthase TruB [Bdellovibrionota bacterium]